MSKITSWSAKPIGKAAGLAAGLIAALALIGSGTVARAATITVNSIADDTNAGHCTLREAINSANGSSGTGNCAAGTGTDSIVFGVTGTIILGGGLPIIAGKLSITGPGSPGITIDGNNKFQVMQVDLSATLNLNKLTIARGKGEGAGINNSGILTVTNTTFADNNNHGGEGGGGIFSRGTLTVTNSTFSGNTADGVFGGGINNSLGTVTVTNSTFSGSRADSAGGIFNSGTMTVTNSTFSGNFGSLGGGGIFNTGTLMVTNSTFSGNTVGVGGGAVESAHGTVHLKGTILADETSGDNCFGTIIDAGYNISDDGSCRFSAGGSRNSTNPKLDSAGLKDHGGPTRTIALQTGSPAIDAIPFASCTDQAAPPNRLTTDQRGLGRPDPEDGPSGPCDIGAYESGQPPPTPTKTPTPTRTPARTPAPTPKATPTATRKPSGPTPTPKPAAIVSSTSVNDVGAPGSIVAAGTFAITNELAVTETVASATVSVTRPGLFSSMTLSGGGQSVTVTPPTANTTFTFTTPVMIPAGGSVRFSLSAVIAANPVMLGKEIKYAGLTVTTTAPGSRSTWPLSGALLMLGMTLLGLPGRMRRRATILAVLVLGLAAASTGCGGGNNGPPFETSAQELTSVNVTAGGIPEPVAGVPASLGTVSD